MSSARWLGGGLSSCKAEWSIVRTLASSLTEMESLKSSEHMLPELI